MLQASTTWTWHACHNTNRLVLDMDEQMQFCTPYKLRMLNDDALCNPNFNLQDADFYQQVCQYLTQVGLHSEAQICQIALNATAVKHYTKPILAKSWFFNSYQGTQGITGAIVSLESSQQQGAFLLIDCDSSASVCMNLSQQFMLDENLSLGEFEVIKVLNNRLHPIMAQGAVQQRA